MDNTYFIVACCPSDSSYKHWRFLKISREITKNTKYGANMKLLRDRRVWLDVLWSCRCHGYSRVLLQFSPLAAGRRTRHLQFRKWILTLAGLVRIGGFFLERFNGFSKQKNNVLLIFIETRYKGSMRCFYVFSVRYYWSRIEPSPSSSRFLLNFQNICNHTFGIPNIIKKIEKKHFIY